MEKGGYGIILIWQRTSKIKHLSSIHFSIGNHFVVIKNSSSIFYQYRWLSCIKHSKWLLADNLRLCKSCLSIFIHRGRPWCTIWSICLCFFLMGGILVIFWHKHVMQNLFSTSEIVSFTVRSCGLHFCTNSNCRMLTWKGGESAKPFGFGISCTKCKVNRCQIVVVWCFYSTDGQTSSADLAPCCLWEYIRQKLQNQKSKFLHRKLSS